MIVPMTEEYAVRYLDWSYPEPYEFYNIPRAHYDECLEEVMENLPYWFAVIDENDRLLGFYEFSFHEENEEKVMEIGLGLCPEETGKGKGLEFVKQAIAQGRRHFCFPDGPVVLRVLDSNQRAIKTYERAGFKVYGEQKASSFGKPVTFLCMKNSGL